MTSTDSVVATGTTFLQTVEADLKNFWTSTENFVETEAVAAWKSLSTIIAQLLPQQWTILEGLVATALTEVSNGDIGNIITSVLNQAEVKELAWVQQLSSELLQAVVSLVNLNQSQS